MQRTDLEGLKYLGWPKPHHMRKAKYNIGGKKFEQKEITLYKSLSSGEHDENHDVDNTGVCSIRNIVLENILRLNTLEQKCVCVVMVYITHAQ